MAKMVVTPELVSKAKKLANDNYESWGHWVVECFGDKELAEDLSDFETLEEWVDIRIAIAGIHEERSAMFD